MAGLRVCTAVCLAVFLCRWQERGVQTEKFQCKNQAKYIGFSSFITPVAAICHKSLEARRLLSSLSWTSPQGVWSEPPY